MQQCPNDSHPLWLVHALLQDCSSWSCHQQQHPYLPLTLWNPHLEMPSSMHLLSQPPGEPLQVLRHPRDAGPVPWPKYSGTANHTYREKSTSSSLKPQVGKVRSGAKLWLGIVEKNATCSLNLRLGVGESHVDTWAWAKGYEVSYSRAKDTLCIRDPISSIVRWDEQAGEPGIRHVLSLRLNVRRRKGSTPLTSDSDSWVWWMQHSSGSIQICIHSGDDDLWLSLFQQPQRGSSWEAVNAQLEHR
ncbi:hypothetical protein BKA70DRAFT_1512764 [Coprinopsis sp. MPI-PUGE-AT-0042]|nr:hypothetical protein BKA70DRAFT_1512764 [Coprinopsis sp. MPI-PUGE-AT-0042]